MRLLAKLRQTQFRFFATAEKGGKGSKNSGNPKKRGQQGPGDGSKATVEAIQKFIDAAEAAKR